MNGKPLRYIWLLLALGVVLSPLCAEKPGEVPNPRKASGSYVHDGGGVLSPAYFRMIDGICRELQAKTTVELAVVTVGDLGGLGIEEFAEKVFRRLAIGARGRDNGLLLIFSRDDRLLRLEVGYGLEADIPDALASRLLEHEALAHLRGGRFGRGLFLAARDVAAPVAKAAGVTLAIAQPTGWPAEAEPPMSKVQPQPKKKKSWDPLLASAWFAAGILAFVALAIVLTLRRYEKARGKAARERIAGGTPVSVILAWIGAAVSFFLILGFGGNFLTPFIAMLAAPGAATFARLFTGRMLKQRLASYRLPCAKCGSAMDMVGDGEDEKFLSAEQAAEEKAGGMDYEFWHCPQCGAQESLATKLDKAAKCPQCKRRTLTSATVTLVAATKEQGGKTRVIESCLNPTCNYSHIREHATQPLASAGASAPSSARPRPPSFGGGRSGGAGASKKF